MCLARDKQRQDLEETLAKRPFINGSSKSRRARPPRETCRGQRQPRLQRKHTPYVCVLHVQHDNVNIFLCTFSLRGGRRRPQCVVCGVAAQRS